MNETIKQIRFLPEDKTYDIQANVTRQATSETGSRVIEIPDAADAPLVKCSTSITGSQDLHGYDKPWVGGANVNLFMPGEEKTYTENGITFVSDGNGTYTISGRSEADVVCYFSCTPYTTPDGLVTTFALKNTQANGHVTLEFYNGNTRIDYTFMAVVNRSVYGFSGISQKYVTKYGIKITPGEAVNMTIQPMFIHGDVTANVPPFSPYSNICPITAYTEGEIEVSDGDGNTTTHTTTYPSAIYRGSEDVVKGEVTTEWGMIASYAGETLPGEWISDRDEYAPGTSPTTGAQVAYELATPTTSSVTPTNLPIKSLSGYNHIESTTGDMEIEYITKPYEPVIEATDISIEDHGKTIESIITENLEPRMVASRNYSIGELIISGDKAYRATTNIASGATLTVGTNVESTTIEAELAAASSDEKVKQTNFTTTSYTGEEFTLPFSKDNTTNTTTSELYKNTGITVGIRDTDGDTRISLMDPNSTSDTTLHVTNVRSGKIDVFQRNSTTDPMQGIQILPTDISLGGTGNTWYGTTTSLKSAFSGCVKYTDATVDNTANKIVKRDSDLSMYGNLNGFSKNIFPYTKVYSQTDPFIGFNGTKECFTTYLDIVTGNQNTPVYSRLSTALIFFHGIRISNTTSDPETVTFNLTLGVGSSGGEIVDQYCTSSDFTFAAEQASSDNQTTVLRITNSTGSAYRGMLIVRQV